ncbi:MAG: ZIP family metal transporter, partial [Bacillota bacterium]
MFEGLSRFAPAIQALFATLFTWGVTALGAGLVFFFKTI